MRRLTNEEYIEKAKAVWGDEYDYSNTQFVKYRQKIMVRCRKHGEFEIRPLGHVNGVGCQACRKEKGGTRIKMDKDKFIERAREQHGDKFDYSLVVYVDTDISVCIICPEHGEFWQTPYSHMKGAGCKVCSGKKMTFDVFVKRARELHGDKYDYSEVEWVNGDTHIKIVCPLHGSFVQLPRNHIIGVMGCPKCGWSKYTYEEFVEMGRKKFGDRFNYSEFVFLGVNKKSFLICDKHDKRIYTSPLNHLRLVGGGCLECSYSYSSQAGNEWLDSLQLPIKREFPIITKQGKKYQVDGFVAESKTVYEFYGDYWHGNPEVYDAKDTNVRLRKTYGELYEKTIKRHNELISDGYSVIYKWETDHIIEG